VVVRDLTTVETETGSVYVVMPVPASVRAAIAERKRDSAQPQEKVAAQQPAPQSQEAAAGQQQTPRLANGKPDLTGNWNFSAMNWRYGNRRCGPTQVECTRAINQTADFEFEAPSRFGPNRPLYRPEYWDKVQQLDMWTNKEDPVMTCQPLGIPRQGPPRRIYQTATDITFLYGRYADGGGGYGEYRVIPIDGRKHDPAKAIESTYMGYTVGTGRATRWCSTPYRSSIPHGWRAAVSSIPIRCGSWSDSRVRAIRFVTKSPSRIPRCLWSRG